MPENWYGRSSGSRSGSDTVVEAPSSALIELVYWGTVSRRSPAGTGRKGPAGSRGNVSTVGPPAPPPPGPPPGVVSSEPTTTPNNPTQPTPKQKKTKTQTNTVLT